MSSSIYRFKYGDRREYADYFGREMARRLREQAARGVFPRADMLVPVPLSPARYRRRGFNQARLLADVISRDTGIPVREDLLRRDGETAPMKGMTAAARYKNLKKAFHVYGNDVNLKSIMLIDDIYTTGATMDACASRLMEAGARSVCFLALAIGENPLC